MKFYVAALYSEMNKAKYIANIIESCGHTCTSRWINGDEEDMHLNDAAQMDLDDIDNCDFLILLTLKKGTMYKGGGRQVEFGYALAKNKRCIVYGDKEHIFCHLNNVENYNDIVSLQLAVNRK